MTAHPRPSDDDLPLELPRSDGGTDDERAELDDEIDDTDDAEASWIGEERGTDLDAGEGIDALDEETSALDDGTLAIDDDPLDLDPETTWTDGSEAMDELTDDEPPSSDEPPAASDDGAEGFDEREADDEGAEGVSVVARDDEMSELDMGALGELGGESAELDGGLVAIAALDGELVQVRGDGVRIGEHAVRIPLGDGETLGGATAIDEASLLVWTTAGRAFRVSLTEGQLVPVEGVVRMAAGDGAGGVWIADGTTLAHLRSDAETRSLAAPGPLGLAVSVREPEGVYVLLGSGGVSRVRGGALEAWRDGEGLAIACDPAGVPWLALSDRIERLDGRTGAATATIPLPEGPAPRGLAVLDRVVVVLRGDRALSLAVGAAVGPAPARAPDPDRR